MVMVGQVRDMACLFRMRKSPTARRGDCKLTLAREPPARRVDQLAGRRIGTGTSGCAAAAASNPGGEEEAASSRSPMKCLRRRA